jgi:phospholipid-binding lipoprotein MlaA
MIVLFPTLSQAEVPEATDGAATVVNTRPAPDETVTPGVDARDENDLPGPSLLKEDDGGEAGGTEDEIKNEAEPDKTGVEEGLPDPLEPWNRLVFTFNDRLYFWVMKPVSKGYNAVVPEGVRSSVRNFFHNLTMPVRFVSSLLQGKIRSATVELCSFSVNTTIGAAGLFDVAREHFHMESTEKDLGLTLGFYGLGDGFYIIWPFLGPSSLRDTVGMVGDGFLTPVNYVGTTEEVLAVSSYEYVNDVSLHVGEYEDLKESAIEPYVALRNAYFQHRQSQIRE